MLTDPLILSRAFVPNSHVENVPIHRNNERGTLVVPEFYPDSTPNRIVRPCALLIEV
jgi:hypothetical protein